MKNPQPLCFQRRFGPLFLTQALGAYNDNVFKQAVIILLTYQAGMLGVNSSGVWVNAAAGIFILPFFLFSPLAGQLADKGEKSAMIRVIKLAEIGIMLLAALSLYLQSLAFTLLVLFLLGAQSTFFGPIKYSILPQFLSPDELVKGNGLINMGTFVSILIGTLLGGTLIALHNGWLWVSIMALAVSLAGYFASRAIPVAPAVDPGLRLNWNIALQAVRGMDFLRGDRRIFLTALGISWFWFFGALVLAQMPGYVRDVLAGNAAVANSFFAWFVIGVASGSLLCNRLSRNRIELGLVPFGSIGLSIALLDLYFQAGASAATSLIGMAAFYAQSTHWRGLADVVLVGVFGGFYIVPLYALLQCDSPETHRSRIIGALNIMNALFMVVSALLAAGLLVVGLTIPEVLLITSVLNAVVAVYIYSLLPEFLWRFLVWLLISTIYRMQVRGLNHIPRSGAALLVCNHVSYADALAIAGSVPRPIRFVMYHRIYDMPVLHVLFAASKAIPIASAREDAAGLQQAYDEIDRALHSGDLVCIFPEGRLTADGEIGQFRRGVDEILQRRAVPVIPMALQGLWGSAFSRHQANIFYRLLKGIKSRVGLVVGRPVPASQVSARDLQARVSALYEKEI